MTQTITLKYPFTVGGERVETLTFRRPKNRDIEAAEKRKGTPLGQSIEMLADLAGVAPDVIRELDMEDMGQINDWLEPILDPKGERSRDGGK